MKQSCKPRGYPLLHLGLSGKCVSFLCPRWWTTLCRRLTWLFLCWLSQPCVLPWGRASWSVSSILVFFLVLSAVPRNTSPVLWCVWLPCGSLAGFMAVGSCQAANLSSTVAGLIWAKISTCDLYNMLVTWGLLFTLSFLTKGIRIVIKETASTWDAKLKS